MPTLPVDPILELLERVAMTARELGIETAVIGAVAMAAHRYVRATLDGDLGTHVDPRTDLARLRDTLAAQGLRVELRMPDEDDSLGGVLRVWEHEDEDNNPIDYVDVVNFNNPHRPGRRNPGRDAVRGAVSIEGRPDLRYVRLPDLIALKLYTGSRRDEADVFELLRRNLDADLAEVESLAKVFGLDSVLREMLDEIRAAQQPD